MNVNTGIQSNDPLAMVALRRDPDVTGRNRLRTALRDVLNVLECDGSSVRRMRVGVYATAQSVLRSRPMDGVLARAEQSFLYAALGAVMEEVVRHNLLAPTSVAYTSAMEAMATIEGGRS